MVMCGYIDIIKGILYVIAQLCGACLGALMLKAAFPSSDQGNLGLHQLGPGVSIANGIVMEGMLTFVLVFVILRTDKDGRAVGTNAPLAIGFTVLVDHLIGVPITGASMNPARSFGPAVVTDNFHDFYVYIAGPVAGSMLAALCYIALYRNAPKDKDD